MKQAYEEIEEIEKEYSEELAKRFKTNNQLNNFNFSGEFRVRLRLLAKNISQKESNPADYLKELERIKLNKPLKEEILDLLLLWTEIRKNQIELLCEQNPPGRPMLLLNNEVLAALRKLKSDKTIDKNEVKQLNESEEEFENILKREKKEDETFD